MYPGFQAKIRPQQPAIIMAQSGETITYAELDRRSNQLAHLLRASGLARLHRAVVTAIADGMADQAPTRRVVNSR